MPDWEFEVIRHLEGQAHRSFKTKDLARALKIPRSRYRAFRSEIVKLAKAGKIAQLPRRRWQAISGAVVLEGRVTGIASMASHVRLADGNSLPLAPGQQEGVAVGDSVRVRRQRIEGVEMLLVRQILRAAPRTVFGSLLHVGQRWVLIPDGRIPGLSGGFFVEDDSGLDSSHEDSLARAHLPAFDPSTSRPLATELEILGPADHPKAAILRLIAQRGWAQPFSEEALEQARQPGEETIARRDLTASLVFTIDPQDAKDHDDAVSIDVDEDGGYALGVHIADVASFVLARSALDREARARATSVYPPGDVLPMLPENLSAGECSLHHGVPRRSISVILRYSRDGSRRGFSLGPSRIHSRASLTYELAEELLGDGEVRLPDQRTEVSAGELRPKLHAMLALAQALRSRRRDKGSIFVDRPEREFDFGEDGHVESLRLRAGLRSHWIIEEFMLEANRAVAESLHAADLPLLWRVHEDPDEGKVDQLVETLSHLGIRWTPSAPIGGRDYQELLEEASASPMNSVISLLALRSLMKASYRRGRGAHFGLAFEQYTHFTSPIRRYPDLHNQRWLHAMFACFEGGWLDDGVADASRLAKDKLSGAADWEEALRLADHCSEQERAATNLERAAADICAADYLRRHEGEELDGMVVGVVSSGLFVELQDTGLDGFVGVEELPGDWYTLDERRSRFVGERTGRRYGLGQPVRVLLQHVDVASGRVWLTSIRPR